MRRLHEIEQSRDELRHFPTGREAVAAAAHDKPQFRLTTMGSLAVTIFPPFRPTSRTGAHNRILLTTDIVCPDLRH